MITALDATAVIYALQAAARRPEDNAASALVNAYVDWLKGSQLQEIQIPAPAHSEFLTFYAEHDMQQQIVAIMRRGFVVTPFDEEASMRAARIAIQVGGKAFRKRLKQEFDIHFGSTQSR